LGEITLKGLAGYAPKDYFIFEPGTWRGREDREPGSTVQKENALSLLYHNGNPRLLGSDIKEWSLDRRLRDPSIQGRWHLTFCLKMRACRSPMVALTYGAWSHRELGFSQGCPPL
jgi:hypothetical protein